MPSVSIANAQDDGMQTGTLKWFDQEKRYGFIVPDQGGRDVFCHWSVFEACQTNIPERGEPVAYRQKVTEKGPQAEEIYELETGDHEQH